MVSVGRIFITLILLISSISSAKCLSISRKEYFERSPVVFKGLVRDIQEKKDGHRKDILIKIEVLSVFKGNLKDKYLDVKYFWMDVKEPLKEFKKDQTYILLGEIKARSFILQTSSCYPNFTEEEISTFNK